jgi:hypothetical protein
MARPARERRRAVDEAGAAHRRGDHLMAKRALHPKMVERAAAVKHAHAHLTKTVPGFLKLPGHQQLKHTQAHVSKQLKGGFY